jgi:hypothetical protein
VYSIKFPNREYATRVGNAYVLFDESVEDYAEVPVFELPKGFPVSLFYRQCHR